jgi:hypothetical protein
VLTYTAANCYASQPELVVRLAGTGGPSSLETPRNQPALLIPGDFIWPRAGSYDRGFQSNLNGSAANPMMVRNNRGERVSIDGMGTKTHLPSLARTPGFGRMSAQMAARTRFASTVGDAPASTGITVYAPNINYIKLAVHHISRGFSACAL